MWGDAVESITAVLDACVLVPAPLCDLLLRVASAGMYQLRWTDDILEEVRRTLVNDLGRSDEQAQKRIVAMRGAFPEALVTGHDRLIASMTTILKIGMSSLRRSSRMRQ